MESFCSLKLRMSCLHGYRPRTLRTGYGSKHFCVPAQLIVTQLWLQDAHLHLIPLSIRSSASTMPRQMPDDEEGGRQYDPEAWISEEDAVRAVRTGKYKADEKMEQAVWERIAWYVWFPSLALCIG